MEVDCNPVRPGLDFNDVFGGPPRRFSMQEPRFRYSFGEKPIFGERDGNFFDDIFRGDGSRIMSPKTEPFATSLPPHLGVPAKLNKTINGWSCTRSSSVSSISRFSNEVRMSDKKGSGQVLKSRKSIDGNGNQFYSSIYKWAGKGIPMLKGLKSKDKPSFERCSSFNGRTLQSQEEEKQLNNSMAPIQIIKQEEAINKKNVDRNDGDVNQNTELDGEGLEQMKVLDAKVEEWCVGKKGNIRSLLSTLHYVLWAGSGWKPIPLVDLIETDSVKRAYQKALLRLHPDKMQQKGAGFHDKHIALQVFDILQEAWDHFNALMQL